MEPTDEFRHRLKKGTKNYPRELEATLANLDRLQKALRNGANPLDIPLGCLHREQKGVLAVDQKGHGNNLAQTQLYVYLDFDTKVIHLISIGQKQSQNADVKFASQFVESLKKGKARGESHGQ